MVKNMKRGNNRIVKAIAYLMVFVLCVPLFGVAAGKKTAAKDNTIFLNRAVIARFFLYKKTRRLKPPCFKFDLIKRLCQVACTFWS